MSDAKNKIFSNCSEIMYYELSEVVEYENDVEKHKKFIADPM